MLKLSYRATYALKTKLRRISPRFYSWAFNLRHSHLIRKFQYLLLSRQQRHILDANYPLFLIDISGRIGLGATMICALRVFCYCEKNGLTPFIRFSSPLYAQDPDICQDWLEHLFVRKMYLETEISPDNFLDVGGIVSDRLSNSLDDADIQSAHEVFFKYLEIQPALLGQAHDFCRASDIGEHTLGVHYRGTDKYLETPRTEFETMRLAVEAQVNKASFLNIFIATDEPKFLAYMRATFSKHLIVDLACKEIYGGDRPPHITPGDGLVKGREALLTIVVLSMCGHCIRTSSYLSAWSKILNPKLDTTLITDVNDAMSLPFPDNILWHPSCKS